MGSDKAFLTKPSSGINLLEHSIAVVGELIREGRLDNVVVSGDLPAYRGVPDSAPGLGPLGGISSVLTSEECQATTLALVLPVDLPRVSADILSKLVAAIDLEQSAIAAHYNGSFMPLVLRADEKVRRIVDSLLAENTPPHERSVRNLLSHLETKVIQPTEADEMALLNTNTLHEWQCFVAEETK